MIRWLLSGFLKTYAFVMGNLSMEGSQGVDELNSYCSFLFDVESHVIHAVHVTENNLKH